MDNSKIFVNIYNFYIKKRDLNPNWKKLITPFFGIQLIYGVKHIRFWRGYPAINLFVSVFFHILVKKFFGK